MLNIAYFGTPIFSANLLEKLVSSKLVNVSLVVTQPDKPVGRNQIITSSPVKQVAHKYGIEVFDRNELSELPELLITKEIDFGLVFSYGKIITAELLSSPKIKFGDTGFGFLNIHPSLLPKYRGASPIVFSLLLGDKETGVSLMVMDEKMDHGPLLDQEKLAIEDTDTTQTLTNKLTSLAQDMVIKTIKQLTIKRDNDITTTPQNHNFASFTRSLSRNNGFIPLSLLQKALYGEPISPNEFPEIIQWYNSRNNQQSTIGNRQSSVDVINRMFRSLSLWPGLWTNMEINGVTKRLILKRITTSDQRLTIVSLQLEGKKEVDFETFNKAYNLLK